MKKLSIIIPVYNEEKTVLKILDKVRKVNLADFSKEIIIVDDGSTDSTGKILSEVKTFPNENLKIFNLEKNRGKGAALRFGFIKATGDYILIQDADLEYDPEEYGELLKPLTENKADVVYGSRFLGDKPHRALFFWHYLGNKVLTLLSNIFTNLNLSDMETCYKVFSREALNKIVPDLRSDRFGIEPEMTALAASAGLRFFEVGISYSGRTYEEGKHIGWEDGISAVWTILKTKWRVSSFGRDVYKSALILVLAVLAVFSIAVLRPNIGGDSVSYVDTMNFIKTGIEPAGWTPYRLIPTYLGMLSVLSVDSVFHNLNFSWLLLNSILYVAMGILFYSLAKKLFDSSLVAFLCALFLSTNYAAITAGLSYLMDIGGWVFYLAAISSSYIYLSKNNRGYLYLSSLCLGAGGLFKENALFAFIAIVGSIIFVERKNVSKMINLIVLSGLISFGPFILMNIYCLWKYDYTYLNWLHAQSVYVYNSRIVEYIKAFGSLYNFGWFVFIPGLYLFLKETKEKISDKKIFFMWLVVLSSLPVFIWAAITQRILFITMPAVVLISGIAISKIKRKLSFIIPLFVLYIMTNYLMDSVILKVVNLGSVLSLFK